VQHLDRCGALTSSLLAIHANWLAPGDADLLARRGAHIVHCPRSHAYFRHAAFPFEALTTAGASISLATDSLASVFKVNKRPPELNLFEEMREFGRRFPSVSPEAILKMVTLNPAAALGAKGRLGELRVGGRADLIAVPAARRDLFNSLINHPGQVAASMIDGRWILPPS